jgi:hypothetical protein
MSEQPKCFDVIGPKTIAQVLQDLRAETNSSDPCDVWLSTNKEPGVGLEMFGDWAKAAEDEYEYKVEATANGISITGESKEAHNHGLKNAKTGEMKFSTPVKHKLKPLFITRMVNEENATDVTEPLATERETENLVKLIIKSKSQDKPVRYLINAYGSLKYLPLLQRRCPWLTVYNFDDLGHLTGDFTKQGIYPHRERLKTDWRKDAATFVDLPEEKPVMLIEHLIPEKALTVMAAPSYTGKTHLAIEMGLSLATGTDFLDFFEGPALSVPVIYHVPELHASLFKSFMERLGAEERLHGCLENFLIRSLERDVWPLDSPQMIESARGRYVFLDTFGYFNDGDDSASYTQAIDFAKKINNLIREGCLGVCGLYHPPKYSKNKKETQNLMTLENQILGSAGYGGVLRSCLGMRNLHDDSNKGLWVYVQGLKNPGLGGPFQVEGIPLRLIQKPGDSPYLNELLKDGGSRREEAIAMLKEGKSRREVCKQLRIAPKTLTKWKQEEMNFDSKEENDND